VLALCAAIVIVVHELAQKVPIVVSQLFVVNYETAAIKKV